MPSSAIDRLEFLSGQQRPFEASAFEQLGSSVLSRLGRSSIEVSRHFSH